MEMLTAVVLVTIAVLGAAIALRERAAPIVIPGTGVAFVVLALVALSAVSWPGPFQSAADLTLQAMGVTEQVRALDDALPLNDLVDASSGLMAAVDELSLGSASLLDIASALLGDRGSARGRSDGSAGAGEDAASAARPPTRILENSIYPGLVAVVAAVFRIGALVVSMAGMVAVTALGYGASALRDRGAARREVRDLEARVATLETRLVLRTGEPPVPDLPSN